MMAYVLYEKSHHDALFKPAKPGDAPLLEDQKAYLADGPGPHNKPIETDEKFSFGWHDPRGIFGSEDAA